ncbi:MAG: type II toxin-antitoxin system RelE/ParE family toxin [Ruminobacter sp.]|uniref:type II toxin-antitoxin system RelE/ParE family toxin n=1 Tax=Ruminobacter sp. TaxID=2774296 RepID=UPI001B51D977|nr:type II toxin-antitoxin system RelE/ParE family toxin [Ruminobacter sp.]
MKHLKDKIWELRPQRNRVLFVTWENDSFVLLHTFVKLKKRQKKKLKRHKENYLI